MDVAKIGAGGFVMAGTTFFVVVLFSLIIPNIWNQPECLRVERIFLIDVILKRRKEKHFASHRFFFTLPSFQC
jgi:hypothetical protein